MNEHVDDVITVEADEMEIIDNETGETIECGDKFKTAKIVGGAVGLGIIIFVLCKKKIKKGVYDLATKYVAKHSEEYSSEVTEEE